MSFNVDVQTVKSGYDRKSCWVQTRAGYIPMLDKAIITTQKLRLSGSDIFYAINSMVSNDSGRTWGDLVEQDAFKQRNRGDGSYFFVSDFCPKWHKTTETLLGTGHTPVYKDDQHYTGEYSRLPAYSTYDTEADRWTDWKFMELPDDVPLLHNCGAGSTQRVDLQNGEILLPVYCRDMSKSKETFSGTYYCAVLRCAFDGTELRYLGHGSFMTVDVPRGFCEPSLAVMNGKYYLTIRNDAKGYLAVSEDGLNYGEAIPWRFDDGKEIGNYNTQQHWVTFKGNLYLVYTRRGLDNNHVFRHRAPLVIAQFDPEKLCLVRDSEQIVVPERGARLGNFGTTKIGDDEVWVVVSEWMQGPKGTKGDPAELEAHGSDNSIFISRLT